MTANRGLLISVEGCDRGGKTTQCKLLIEWLQSQHGIKCEYVKFPERSTEIGKVINEYLTGNSQLNDETIHLLFSVNRWELKDMMEEKLSNGITLILDRYAYSGVAYSSAKGLDLDWCKAPDHGLLKPDLVLFLDVPVEGSAQRDGYGEERYEQLELQKKVYAKFGLLHDETWTIINGVGSIEEVSSRLRETTSSFVKNFDQHCYPLKTLDWA